MGAPTGSARRAEVPQKGKRSIGLPRVGEALRRAGGGRGEGGEEEEREGEEPHGPILIRYFGG